MRVGSTLTAVGFLAWMAALAVAAAGQTDGATLAAAQTVAMIGATLVGIVLVREGDWPIGVLVVIGSVAMLVPWTAAWLVFGGTWTAIGVLLGLTWSHGRTIGGLPA
jgi:adenosine/AMP kinase